MQLLETVTEVAGRIGTQMFVTLAQSEEGAHQRSKQVKTPLKCTSVEGDSKCASKT